nr:MAG TPA: YjcQ protein [Caudoviricetes sp.]
MSRLIDTATKEVARVAVLETLEEAGITGCSTQVLTQVLNKSMVEGDIENILLYLESKKLIRCKSYENARQGIKRTVYFITDKGIDFLDGNVEEVGLCDG